MAEGVTASTIPELGPVASELDSVQGGAKWLVGAAASGLAVLVAGVSLPVVAGVAFHGGWLLFAVTGLCLVALSAVGAILSLAARVLVHPGWTLNAIAHMEAEDPDKWRKHWLCEALDARRGFLMPDIPDPDRAGGGPAELADAAAARPKLRPGRLYQHHQQLLQAWFELAERGRTVVVGDLLDDRSRIKVTYSSHVTAEADRLRSRLATTAAAASRVASVANILEVRRRYQRLVTKQLPLLGGSAVTSVLVLILLVAANAEVPITAPVQMDIRVTTDKQALKSNRLPPGCAGRTIRATAVNGSLTNPVVTSISEPACRLNQVDVSPEVGTVVPLAGVK